MADESECKRRKHNIGAGEENTPFKADHKAEWELWENLRSQINGLMSHKKPDGKTNIYSSYIEKKSKTSPL